MLDYELAVYRGTFVQLSRLPQDTASGSKPVLMRNRGVLWVSVADGRIKGCDWQARDKEGFRALMRKHGWFDTDAPVYENGVDTSMIKVKIITAEEGRNEFFFPGFIGTIFPAQASLWLTPV